MNYFRYLVVILLFGSLFYNYHLEIEQSTIAKKLEQKLPIIIDKEGLIITIKDINILNISKGIVKSKVDTSVKVSSANKFSKFLPKKSIDFSLTSKTVPMLQGSYLSFEVLSLELNRIIKVKKVKGLLKTKLEAIKVPIKKLKNIAWFSSIKEIKFQDTGKLLITFGVSKLLIFLLIPLFLLREIGLFIIVFYQKFLSPRKKYCCARGELYGDGTCSSITKEAFKEHGFIAGIKVYRKTTKKCKEAYKSLKKKDRRDGTSCDYCSCGSGCDGAACGGEASTGLCSCDVGSC